MALALTTRTTWINRITTRLEELQVEFLKDRHIDKKTLINAKSISITRDLSLFEDVVAWQANKVKIDKLEANSRKRRDKINAETKEKVAILKTQNKIHQKNFVEVAQGLDTFVHAHSEPKFNVFDKMSRVQVEANLREQYPQYANYAAMMLKIPLKIDLITTPASLRDYLIRFLPTIGIDVD